MFKFSHPSKSSSAFLESDLSVRTQVASVPEQTKNDLVFDDTIIGIHDSIHPYALGASLYMPATRQDIWQVINREKLPNLNSVIICLEDSVNEIDVPHALHNVQQLLTRWGSAELNSYQIATQKLSVLSDATHTHIDNNDDIADYKQLTLKRPLVFIRARNPHMLMQIEDMAHSELFDGYVLPKVDMDSLSNWRMACQQISANRLLMPTLETGRLFDAQHNQELKVALDYAFGARVFALRIGGNDLFASLRQRRPNDSTIYDTPIGSLIYQLLGTFAVQGYYLTAPVFEYFANSSLFLQELEKDVSLGLVGKTVIHPNQISLVQQAFSVPASVLSEAEAILAQDAKAVFKFNDTMLEPATHRAWAREVVQRAKVFGSIKRSVI